MSKEEDEELLRTLGGRVKWARLKRELSQPELAAAAGVRQGTIGNLESGIRKKPRELLAIAAALRVSPTWLESGKGSWEISIQPPPVVGNLFEELTEDEKRLLENFRAMLDDDQRAIAEDIATRAAKMRAYTAKVLERVGAAARPARSAADARRTEVARAALDIDEEPRRNALFEASKSEDK